MKTIKLKWSMIKYQIKICKLKDKQKMKRINKIRYYNKRFKILTK